MNSIRIDQLQKVWKAFKDKPKTMKEVDVETGVMRENICRHCRRLRLSNRLFEVGKRRCRITKHIATIYSTNSDFAPNPNQLSLF